MPRHPHDKPSLHRIDPPHHHPPHRRGGWAPPFPTPADYDVFYRVYGDEELAHAAGRIAASGPPEIGLLVSLIVHLHKRVEALNVQLDALASGPIVRK